LPLRAEKADGFGGVITVTDAERMLAGWDTALSKGKLLLFLSSIKRVSIWCWRPGCEKPECVIDVCKDFRDSEPVFTRLPSMLPDTARGSYAALRCYLANADPSARECLSKVNKSLVAVKTTKAARASETSWLVYQRFDAVTLGILKTIQEGSPVVPIIGIALPMRHNQAPKAFIGGVSCFLPIGDLQTFLPVHLNARFNVHKNRRNIWLPGPSLTHEHERWAKWNDMLLSDALPNLWLEALRDLATRQSAGESIDDGVFSLLPDLLHVGEMWQPCAVKLYRLIRDVPFLPHPAGGNWVSPESSCVLVLPTEAFRAQASSLPRLYEAGCEAANPKLLTQPARRGPTESSSSMRRNIVFVPEHIEKAMLQHSGLSSLPIEDFVESLLPWVEGSLLSPMLIALAELAESQSWKSKWKAKLAAIAWVPLCRGGFAKPYEAFAPGQRHLIDAKLRVVELATANLSLECTSQAAVLRTVLDWGLKAELDWVDVIAEAREVAYRLDIENANRLLEYLQRRHSCVTGDRECALAELNTIRFLPAHLADPDRATPETVKLHAPEDVLHLSERPLVWAVQPTAAISFDVGLSYKVLTTQHLISQIRVLAGRPEDVGSNMLAVCKRLKLLTRDLATTLKPLQDLAWLPIATAQRGASHGRFRMPGQIVLDSRFDLSPTFCKPLDQWRVSVPDILQAAGAHTKVSGKDLVKAVAEIHEMSQTSASKHVGIPEVEAQVIDLLHELAARASNDCSLQEQLRKDGCFVLTTGRVLNCNVETFLDDAQWTRGSRDVAVLHGHIGNEEGRLLGCTSIRDELAHRCEEDGDGSFGEGSTEEFGQHEVLADRISGLLHDYNRPSDVFTEHWQNSDDAGAERLLFMLDETSYSTISLVDARASVLQGPALILASSKALSDDDIKRIQALGNSLKCKDFCSVGRFGVGINTLYHMSDTPVLLANQAMHIFDPLQEVVAERKCVGKRFAVNKLRSEGFLDMLAPLIHLGEWPTVFRLPLRRRCSPKWKHALSTWTSSCRVEALLREFAGRMQVEERLVFSKHVHSVQVCVKRISGEQCSIAQFQTLRVTSAHQLMQNLPKTLPEVEALLSCPRHEVAEIEIASAGSTSRWIVSHAVEADETLMALVRNKYDAGVALLPHGAAALCLNPPQDYRGHWCCQLPLSELAVGLPMLVHGFFDLSSSRKIVPLPGPSEANPSLQTRWNKQLLRGPIASSLSRLIAQYRDKIDPSDDCSVERYFGLMELGKGKEKASSALHEVAYAALLRQLLTRDAIFPVIIDSAEKGKRKIRTWLSGPSLTTHASSLTAKAHAFLVALGMDLVDLPATLATGLKEAAKSLGADGPRALSDSDVCKYLRNKDPAVVRNAAAYGKDNYCVINELLAFVVGKTVPSKPDFSNLIGVPLLLLHSGELRAFGNPGCFFDWHELLPHEPCRFLDLQQLRIFLSSHSKSREAVLEAVQAVGIRSFTPADLREHRVHIHSVPKRLVDNDAWRQAFWRLMWQHKGALSCVPLSFAGFHDWHVLPVLAKGTEVKVMELSTVSTCFSVHATDPKWREDIVEILWGCGYNVLDPDISKDPNHFEMLKPHVRSGDEGVLALLHGASESFGAIDQVHQRVGAGRVFTYPSLLYVPKSAASQVQRRMKIMQFLASRRDEFFTPQNIAKIRSLRLFPVSNPGEAACFTDLSDSSKQFVCLRNDPTAVCDHVPSLMALDLPDANVRHLSVPLEEFSALYKRIGVQTNLWTSDFVVKLVCGTLPGAARRGFSTLQPMLRAVESWWDSGEDETLRSKVRDAIKEVAFVVTADGGVPVTAWCLVDPNLPVAQAFATHLGDKLPSADMNDFLPLLRRLGMKGSLPPELVHRCALVFDQHVQQKEDSGAALDESMQKDACLLVRALCNGYKDVNSHRDTSHMKMLNAVTGLRIALVHPPCYGVGPVPYIKALATTLTEPRSPRPRPDQPLLRLCTFRSLLMDPAVEAICWTQHSSLAQPAGSRELSKLMDDVRQEIWTQLLHDSKLADALDLYCDPLRAPIKAVLKQLQYLVEQLTIVPDLQGALCPKTHLMQELTSIYKILDERVAEISPDDVRSLRKMACVPIQIDRDASGDLGDGSKVTLCFPERCFFEMPDRAEIEMRGYMYLWPRGGSRDPIG
jgi:hypothetical protein